MAGFGKDFTAIRRALRRLKRIISAPGGREFIRRKLLFYLALCRRNRPMRSARQPNGGLSDHRSEYHVSIRLLPSSGAGGFAGKSHRGGWESWQALKAHFNA
jgi:hypothetical protein